MTKNPTMRRRVQIDCSASKENPSRVKPEFQEEQDINKIMGRYKGPIPAGYADASARFGDFSQVPTYEEMYEKVQAAQNLFAALPSDIRLRFENNPGKFLAATETPEGIQLLKDLGLGKPQENDSQANSTALNPSNPPGQPSPSETHQENPAKGVAAKTGSKTTQKVD